jgi:hypothetical protein
MYTIILHQKYSFKPPATTLGGIVATRIANPQPKSCKNSNDFSNLGFGVGYPGCTKGDRPRSPNSNQDPLPAGLPEVPSVKAPSAPKGHLRWARRPAPQRGAFGGRRCPLGKATWPTGGRLAQGANERAYEN